MKGSGGLREFFKWLRKWEWIKLVELPAGLILKPTKAIMGNDFRA